MELIPLELDGVLGIKSTVSRDERGSFLRVFDATTLADNFTLDQASIAVNPMARTLRGLHYQENPHAETKIIQCVTGRVFDVLVDIQKDSPSFGQHVSLLLGPSETYQGVFVAKGFAHGYLTLESDSTLLYFMDHPYVHESARGIVWDDPALQIGWPFEPVIISTRDKSFHQILSL